MGAPYETNGQQKTGDVYKCPVTSDSPSNCTKLNLGTEHRVRGELGASNELLLVVTALFFKIRLGVLPRLLPKAWGPHFRRIF